MDHVKMGPAIFLMSSIIYLLEHTLPSYVSSWYGLSEVKMSVCNKAHWGRKFHGIICNYRVSNVNNSAGANEAWPLFYT